MAARYISVLFLSCASPEAMQVVYDALVVFGSGRSDYSLDAYLERGQLKVSDGEVDEERLDAQLYFARDVLQAVSEAIPLQSLTTVVLDIGVLHDKFVVSMRSPGQALNALLDLYPDLELVFSVYPVNDDVEN